MSFARMLVSTGFVCAMASPVQALAWNLPSDPSRDPMAGLRAMQQRASLACGDKSVGAVCSYQDMKGKPIDGKCIQPAPIVVGYGTKIPVAPMCQATQQTAAATSPPPRPSPSENRTGNLVPKPAQAPKPASQWCPNGLPRIDPLMGGAPRC